jgi:hypothetical protein
VSDEIDRLALLDVSVELPGGRTKLDIVGWLCAVDVTEFSSGVVIVPVDTVAEMGAGSGPGGAGGIVIGGLGSSSRHVTARGSPALWSPSQIRRI